MFSLTRVCFIVIAISLSPLTLKVGEGCSFSCVTVPPLLKRSFPTVSESSTVEPWVDGKTTLF